MLNASVTSGNELRVGSPATRGCSGSLRELFGHRRFLPELARPVFVHRPGPFQAAFVVRRPSSSTAEEYVPTARRHRSLSPYRDATSINVRAAVSKSSKASIKSSSITGAPSSAQDRLWSGTMDNASRDNRIPLSGDALRDLMGAACAEALRAAHPKNTSKHLERATGADSRTIDGWLSGRMPGTAHYALLVRAYGQPFVDLVHAPVIGREETVADILGQIDAAMVRLKRKIRNGEIAESEIRSVLARS